MKKNFTLFLMICFSMAAAQNTVGLLSYNPAKAFDGYNLFYPHNQPNVYLLDMCGEIVHVWEDAPDVRPGNTAYLRPDGTLVKTKRPAAVANDPIWAGGGGATVEIRDWDNNLLWSYTLNDSTARLHHDIEPMPNGNILMIAWEVKNEQDLLAAGRDTATTSQNMLWSERLFEINPATNEIVWEWHAWDHLIQDFDAAKANYGVVSAHPELIDVNFLTNNGKPDWMHANAIDFNENLNQIMLGVPFFGEIWVIDHSTTTAQAAGHIGGMGNRGGDLLYRWGNPATYKIAADQKLFNPHDAHWVDDFLDFSNPLFGKVAVFNNRVGPDFSTANIFTPDWDMYEWKYPLTGDHWGPSDFNVTLTHPVSPQNLYSTGLSSIQVLPNGNYLICDGRHGYTFELTPDNQIVWEYKTPLLAGQPASQGDTLTINNNLTFRFNRLPADFPAFEGKDLSPKGWIELNPDTTFCDQILPVTNRMSTYHLQIYPNPANNTLTLEWTGGIWSEVAIFDQFGREMTRFTATGGRKFLDISDYPAGLYYVQIGGIEVRKLLIAR
ncbi:MAG: T9SS C-terminal target domain-containing protein [Bacteroidetes bacterium]|nr:MAG: T9SS C-terminal target domain-containing protein [Bacteroidota bacterium]